MGNSKSSGGDAPEGGTPEPSGSDGSTEKHKEDISIVYCVFPNAEIAIGEFLPGNILLYDRHTPFYLQRSAEEWDVPILHKNLLPEPTMDPQGRFMQQLGINSEQMPRDSVRASLLRWWVFARSSAMLVHLDSGEHFPEAMVANLVGMPVVGVTDRHSISPMVSSIVSITVKPERSLIASAVMSLIDHVDSNTG